MKNLTVIPKSVTDSLWAGLNWWYEISKGFVTE